LHNASDSVYCSPSVTWPLAEWMLELNDQSLTSYNPSITGYGKSQVSQYYAPLHIGTIIMLLKSRSNLSSLNQFELSDLVDMLLCMIQDSQPPLSAMVLLMPVQAG